MTDADWHVWPLFIIELIAFLLLFVRSDFCFLKLKIQTWIIIILLGVDVGIALSVAHDSTDPLHLYF